MLVEGAAFGDAQGGRGSCPGFIHVADRESSSVDGQVDLLGGGQRAGRETLRRVCATPIASAPGPGSGASASRIEVEGRVRGGRANAEVSAFVFASSSTTFSQ